MPSNEFSYIENKLNETKRQLYSLSSEFEQMKGEIGFLGQHIAKAIAESGEAVSSMVAANTKQIQSSLKETSSFTGQVELAKQLAQLKTTGDVVELMQDALAEKVKQIQKRKEEIGTQFRTKEDDIVGSYQRDVRRIGAHIYEPLEIDFDGNIAGRFKRGARQNALSHQVIQEVECRRKKALHERWDACFAAAKAVVADRKRFREVIDKKSCVPATRKSAPRRVCIPLWRITRAKENRVKMITPSTVMPASKGSGLQPNPLLVGIAEKKDRQSIRFPDSKVLPLQHKLAEAICTELDQMRIPGSDPEVVEILKNMVRRDAPLVSAEVQS